MSEDFKHIKFQNQYNPKASFDLVILEELFRRSALDHNPEKLHRVNFYMIIFITEGPGQHTIDFTDYKLTKGSVLTIRKDQVHKFIKIKSLKGYLLLFTDDFLVSYLEKLEALKSLQLFNELLAVPKIQLQKEDTTSTLQLIKQIEQEYFNINDDYSLGIIRSQLHILITQLYRIKSKEDAYVYNRKYLAEFIEFQKLVERKASKTNKVQDYARLMGLSTKTLNTVTKNIVSKTAKEFVDDICIKQIKRLLINTELSIKEIAYDSGFEETTNFYKYFKRQVKTTPERFRAKYH